MKILYIEAKRKSETKDISGIDFSKLPKKLMLLYSIQYKELAESIKIHLKDLGFEIKGFQQVLGCTKLKTSYPMLLIGSGEFHALNLALQNSAPIYIMTGNVLTLLSQNEIDQLKSRKHGAYSKFLHATTLGIIVTAKPGQENLQKAILLKGRIEKKYPEKKVFLFISNNISLSQFENFPIDFWINTACPGLFYDSQNLINLDDILGFLG